MNIMGIGMGNTFCLQRTPYIEKRVVVRETSTQYEFFTGWFLATGVDSIRAAIKQDDTSGLVQTQLCIQVAANRPDLPGTITTFGSMSSSAAYSTGDASVTSALATQQWFRVGVAYKLSSATGLPGVNIGLEAHWQQLGSLIETRRISVETNTTSARYVAVTDWFPRKFASKVKVAFDVNGSGTTLQYQVALQTATHSVQLPGSWDTTGFTANTYPAGGPTEYNTGEVTPASSNDMWIRVGVLYQLSAGSSQTYGFITATTSIRS
jgi:hypothetical protein